MIHVQKYDYLRLLMYKNMTLKAFLMYKFMTFHVQKYESPFLFMYKSMT